MAIGIPNAMRADANELGVRTHCGGRLRVDDAIGQHPARLVTTPRDFLEADRRVHADSEA